MFADNFFESPPRIEYAPIVFDSPSSSSPQTFSSKTLATLSSAASRYHRSSGYSSTSSNVSQSQLTNMTSANAPLHMTYALKSDKFFFGPRNTAISASNLLADRYTTQKNASCYSNTGLRKGSLSPKAKQRSLTPLTFRRRSFSSKINPTDVLPILNNKTEMLINNNLNSFRQDNCSRFSNFLSRRLRNSRIMTEKPKKQNKILE